MSGDWKPGDVAMVTGRWVIGADHSTRRSYRDGGMWANADDRFRPVADWEVSEVRPLVVIDPEDAEQVKALCGHWEAVKYGTTGEVPMTMFELHMQSALREFADPKPAEPRGLGAVVEDEAGVLWTRTEHKPNITGTVWVSAFHVSEADSSLFREYADIDAVRVLSDGVTTDLGGE